MKNRLPMFLTAITGILVMFPATKLLAFESVNIAITPFQSEKWAYMQNTTIEDYTRKIYNELVAGSTPTSTELVVHPYFVETEGGITAEKNGFIFSFNIIEGSQDIGYICFEIEGGVMVDKRRPHHGENPCVELETGDGPVAMILMQK